MHMAVTVCIHAAVIATRHERNKEEEKKKEVKRWKKRRRRRLTKRSLDRGMCLCAPLIISSVRQWPPCGRLFRGRLNEAD